MTEKLHGLPYWELRLDAGGDPDAAQRSALVTELLASAVTDLFVLCHGWNSSPAWSRAVYDRFFGLVAEAAAGGVAAGTRIGLVGVIWPSMRWADEIIPDFAAVAAAGLDGAEATDAQTFEALRETFPIAEQRKALDRMEELLQQEPDDPARLAEFQDLMAALAVPGDGASEDSGETALVQDPPRVAFGKFLPALAEGARPLPAGPDEGGAAGGAFDAPPDPQGFGAAAGIGDIGRSLWRGAREALRQFSYFQMKNRAGTVGRDGLGPLVGALAVAVPTIRVHLIGHSFGARLVSFALAGLPDVSPSPVKSLVLLQGAFSHFAFAPRLPHRDGAGALAERAAKVDGPLVAVYSVHDSAVRVLYPIASRAAGEDAAGLDAADLAGVTRWGAMGGDGAQGVAAATQVLRGCGDGYALAHGSFTNVDARDVVRTGGPPAGAHSDIFHPELAWLALAAAGVTVQGR